MTRWFHVYQDEAGEGGTPGAGAGTAGGEPGPGEGGAPGGEGGAGGAPAGDWKAEIPADYAHLAERFATPADALKSYAELEALRGRAVVVPGADASEEARREFFEKLTKVEGAKDFLAEHGGRTEVPQTPDGYDFGELPEGVPTDDTRRDWFKGIAHKLGLTPEQAKGVVAADAELVLEATQARQAADAENEKALKTEWGPSFDSNLAAAKSVLLQHGTPALKEWVENSNLASSPDFAKFLVNVAKVTGEHSMVHGGDDGGVKTPEDIELELAQVNDEILKLPEGNARRNALKDKAWRLEQQLHTRQGVAG